MYRVPVKHGALLWVPAVGFIDGDDFVIVLSVNHTNGCGFIRLRHSVYLVNFKTENIAATAVPRYGLALANVAEEMMF